MRVMVQFLYFLVYDLNGSFLPSIVEFDCHSGKIFRSLSDLLSVRLLTMKAPIHQPIRSWLRAEGCFNSAVLYLQKANQIDNE